METLAACGAAEDTEDNRFTREDVLHLCIRSEGVLQVKQSAVRSEAAELLETSPDPLIDSVINISV